MFNVDKFVENDQSFDWLAQFDANPTAELLEDAIFLSDDVPDFEESLICICAIVLLVFPSELLQRELISKETRDFVALVVRSQQVQLRSLAKKSLAEIMSNSELRDIRLKRAELASWLESMAVLEKAIATTFN